MKKTKILMPLAGIAAVGAIAPIVTLASCHKGSDYVSQTDKDFLNTANTYLAKKEGQVSAHKAVTVLKNLGIDIQGYHLSNSSCQFAYDASAKRFIIMHGDSVVAAPEKYVMENTQSVFVFTKVYDKNSKYGQYLMDDYELPSNASTLEIKTSIDVGNNQNIEKMTYVGDEKNAKYILIRSYCQTLDITAKKDTIFHMGIANNLAISGDSVTKPDFYEVGWVGYLKTNDVKLNTVVLDNSEGASIDILAPANTSKGAKFVKGTVTVRTADLTGTIKTEQPGTLVNPTQISKITDLTSHATLTEPAYFKLTAKLSFDETNKLFQVAKGETIILDLNGQTLDDASMTTLKTNVIEIVGGGKLVIIDSSDSKAGTIAFTEHYIAIHGDKDPTVQTNQAAELYIEGGNFDFTGTAGNRGGFIKVGYLSTESKTTEAVPEIPYSRFYMYGGNIKTHLAKDVKSGHDNQANAIYALRNNYIQITFGNIESTEVCIRGNGSFNGEDSYIDITGGNFKQTSPDYGECIFQPQGGRLHITGGNFEGRGCIASKNGDVTINGGYFHATGKKADLDPTAGGADEQDTDGSVLCMELKEEQYGVNPSITVHNATLYSENSYVLQVYGKERKAGQSLAEADFFSGIYYYKVDGTLNGIRIADDVLDSIRINQYGGSWVKA